MLDKVEISDNEGEDINDIENGGDKRPSSDSSRDIEDIVLHVEPTRKKACTNQHQAISSSSTLSNVPMATPITIQQKHRPILQHHTKTTTTAITTTPTATAVVATSRKSAPTREYGIKILDKIFHHTSFGCMHSPYVVHVTPQKSCLHDCAYCYAKSYTNFLTDSGLDKMDINQIQEATECEYKRLQRNATRAGYQRRPECHFSISTDCFQPNEVTQEITFAIMQVWLALGGIISVVSKGVPHSPQFRAKLLELWKTYKTSVSYQCTCASTNTEHQLKVEPGAPPPNIRLAFLKDVHKVAGVERISLRMNPLIPGFNDGEDEIINTLAVGAASGAKWAVVSYMYGSDKIFRLMSKRGFGEYINYFHQNKSQIAGGSAKYHVRKDIRMKTTEMAKKQGVNMCIRVITCGCDNQDLYPTEKCGICWNSGGKMY